MSNVGVLTFVLWHASIDAQGQLGIGSLNNVSLPTLVALPANVTVSVIATGLDHACALTTGSYSHSQLNDELIAHRRTPHWSDPNPLPNRLRPLLLGQQYVWR